MCLSANELLTRCNLMRAKEFPSFDTPIPLGRRVAVIGAGNTAMDATRVCLRLGAEKVYCIYRRSRAECPARIEEVHHAEQEGVEFHWLTAPVEILDDGKGSVRGMRCVRMELGEPDASGRRRPVPVAGSEYDFDADMVVYAIGTNANPIIGQTSKLKLDKRGYIETDENLATSMAGVYAGGDIVTGAATVIEAMGAGRKAARSIKAYLGIRDRATSRIERNTVRHRRARAKFRAHQARNEHRNKGQRMISSATLQPGKTITTLKEHIIEVVSDSGEGAQRCGQSLGSIAARTGNGVWTVEIIPAEIRPPARSVAGASGNRIRIGSARVNNGGDEADLVVAFNEQVLLGRVRAGELKPGCIILLESMWRDHADPRIASAYVETHAKLVASGYRVIEVPMERECRAVNPDTKRGKNMFVLGVLCNLYSFDLQLAREQIALTFGKKEQSVIDQNVTLLDAGYAWAEAQLRFQVLDPGNARDRAADRRQRQYGDRARRARLRDGDLRDVSRSRRRPRRRTT